LILLSLRLSKEIGLNATAFLRFLTRKKEYLERFFKAQVEALASFIRLDSQCIKWPKAKRQ
jgi:hypothetical protein